MMLQLAKSKEWDTTFFEGCFLVLYTKENLYAATKAMPSWICFEIGSSKRCSTGQDGGHLDALGEAHVVEINAARVAQIEG